MKGEESRAGREGGNSPCACVAGLQALTASEYGDRIQWVFAAQVGIVCLAQRLHTNDRRK